MICQDIKSICRRPNTEHARETITNDETNALDSHEVPTLSMGQVPSSGCFSVSLAAVCYQHITDGSRSPPLESCVVPL